MRLLYRPFLQQLIFLENFNQEEKNNINNLKNHVKCLFYKPPLEIEGVFLNKYGGILFELN